MLWFSFSSCVDGMITRNDNVPLSNRLIVCRYRQWDLKVSAHLISILHRVDREMLTHFEKSWIRTWRNFSCNYPTGRKLRACRFSILIRNTLKHWSRSGALHLTALHHPLAEVQCLQGVKGHKSSRKREISLKLQIHGQFERAISSFRGKILKWTILFSANHVFRKDPLHKKMYDTYMIRS